MNALRYRLGFALRETGQAVERLGATLQGVNSFQEHSELTLGPGGPRLEGSAGGDLRR
jgi:hypothetical protein